MLTALFFSQHRAFLCSQLAPGHEHDREAQRLDGSARCSAPREAGPQQAQARGGGVQGPVRPPAKRSSIPDFQESTDLGSHSTHSNKTRLAGNHDEGNEREARNHAVKREQFKMCDCSDGSKTAPLAKQNPHAPYAARRTPSLSRCFGPAWLRLGPHLHTLACTPNLAAVILSRNPVPRPSFPGFPRVCALSIHTSATRPRD